MNIRSPFTLMSVLLMAVFTFLSCQKEVSEDTGTQQQQQQQQQQTNTSNTKLVRIQQGTDPDITNDTVFLITYNADNKISTITDSLNEDTLKATYDVNGKITRITETYGTNTSFYYNTDSTLKSINYYLAGSNEKLNFEYSNGIIAKKSYYSDLGAGGTPALQGYFTYTVTNGNITGMKEFTKSGMPVDEVTFTYGSQPNPFKDLSLFNVENLLGAYHIMNEEIYFNKNVSAGYVYGGLTANITFTYNSQQQPVKIINNDRISDKITTWQLGYK